MAVDVDAVPSAIAAHRTVLGLIERVRGSATVGTKAEAALEALKRDSAAEARRLREGLARAEVQEESLAARLLSSEAAAEELRRTYERRLSEQSNQLREARHEGALAVDAERARHEGEAWALRNDLERLTAAHRRHAHART